MWVRTTTEFTDVSIPTNVVYSYTKQGIGEEEVQTITKKYNETKETLDGFNRKLGEVTEQVLNYRIGGRNLLLKTALPVILPINSMGNRAALPENGYYLSVPNVNDLGLVANDSLCLSFKWSLSDFVRIDTSRPAVLKVMFDGETQSTFVKTIDIREDLLNSGNYLYIHKVIDSDWTDSIVRHKVIFSIDNVKTGSVVITNTMLEIATTPSQWRPAPEDSDEKISSVISNTNSLFEQTNRSITSTVQSVTDLSLSIKRASDSIDELKTITDTKYLKKSDFKITEDGILSQISQVNNEISTILASMHFDTTGLTIKTPKMSESTSTRIDGKGFYVIGSDGKKIASFDIVQSSITNLKIVGDLSIGSHIVRKVQMIESGSKINGTGFYWVG